MQAKVPWGNALAGFANVSPADVSRNSGVARDAKACVDSSTR